jgi:hypothetical protein
MSVALAIFICNEFQLRRSGMLNQLSKKANHHKIQTNIFHHIRFQIFLKIQCTPTGRFSFYDVLVDSKYNSPHFLIVILNRKMLQNRVARRNHLQISYP